MYERRLQGFLTRAKYDRDSLDYKIRFLQINTPYNEFGAALLDSGFVFESNRSKKVTRSNEFGWDGLPFTKLYYQLSTNDLANCPRPPCGIVCWSLKQNAIRFL